MIRRILVLTVLLALATGVTTQAAIITYNLTPGGSVSGSPGTTVGWGYSVINSSLTDWVMLTGSSFTGAPGWGTYNDYFLNPANFVLLAPGGNVSQAFDDVLMQGVGGFTIDPLTAAGSNASGFIQLFYDAFDGDPFSGGNQLTFGAWEQAAAQVTASGGGATATPEPGTMILLGSGVLAFGLSRFRRRKEVSA